MLGLFKDPRSAQWAIPGSVVGLIAIGFVLSFPQFSQAKTQQEHSERALARMANCYFLDSGKVQPGGYYAILDKSGKELLLSDGDLVCDRQAGTAQITKKAAGFFRRADMVAFKTEFDRLFPIDENGNQAYPQAIVSTQYKPDPAKRPKATEPEKQPWWAEYEKIAKQIMGG